MPIQIVTDQIGAQQVDAGKIKNSTITAGQMALNGNFNYTGQLQSSGQDVATQAYVDSAIAGLHWKKSAVCASTADIDLTYANGSAGVGATLTAKSNGVCQIDSITLNANDRVLIQNQSDGFECGIYYVSNAGAAGTPYVLTRATDADTPDELKSAAIFIERGTSQNIAFVQTADNVTIGTTDLTFSKFSGTSAIIRGDGIGGTGDTIALALSTLTAAAINVAQDSIAFIDSDNTNKKESIVDLASGMAGSGLAASNGQIALANNSVTVAAGTGLSGGGAIALGASGTLNVDLDELPDAVMALNADKVVIVDGAGASKKEAWADIVNLSAGAGISANAGVYSLTNNSITVTAGDGLSGGGSAALGGSASLALDLNELGALGSVTLADDLIAMIDATDGSSKKYKVESLATAMAGSGISATDGSFSLTNSSLSVNSGDGLSGGGAISLGGAATLSLNLSGLGAPSGGVAVDTDSIAIVDASAANASKKITIAQLITACAGSGLANTSGVLSIAPSGVGSSEIANNAVGTSEIAANAVTIAKIGARPYTESFTGSAATAYDLARAVDANWVDRVQVFRNGLRCKKVASSPADESQYMVSAAGGTGGVCQITFGAGPNTDNIIVDYMT